MAKQTWKAQSVSVRVGGAAHLLEPRANDRNVAEEKSALKVPTPRTTLE